jgi:hypothetical protein
MSKPPPPSDVADKFMLRLPEGMRDRITAAARANQRSINAEIISTLELAYPEPPGKDRTLKVLAWLMDVAQSHPTPAVWLNVVKQAERFREEIERDPELLTRYGDPSV